DFHVTGVQTCALPILDVHRYLKALVRSDRVQERGQGLEVVGQRVAGERAGQAHLKGALARAVAVGGDSSAHGRFAARLPVLQFRSEEHTSELQSRENL